MVFYTFIWKIQNIIFSKFPLFRSLDQRFDGFTRCGIANSWWSADFRVGLRLWGQTVTCDCGSICYQYFFWLNNDCSDAFLGPAARSRRSHQSDNTNIRSYFIKYIPIKLSKKVSKPKPPNRISDSTIHNTKCYHPIHWLSLKKQQWVYVYLGMIAKSWVVRAALNEWGEINFLHVENSWFWKEVIREMISWCFCQPSKRINFRMFHVENTFSHTKYLIFAEISGIL